LLWIKLKTRWITKNASAYKRNWDIPTITKNVCTRNELTKVQISFYMRGVVYEGVVRLDCVWSVRLIMSLVWCSLIVWVSAWLCVGMCLVCVCVCYVIQVLFVIYMTHLLFLAKQTQTSVVCIWKPNSSSLFKSNKLDIIG